MDHNIVEIRRQAMEITAEIRADILKHVIAGKVANDRVGDLEEAIVKDITAGKRIDIRPVRLMAISGKGGPGFLGWTNVSLLDHLLNVSLGAVMIAAIDLLGVGTDREIVRRVCSVVAAVGFSHDPNKVFGKAFSELTLEDIKNFADTYGVLDWLSSCGVALNAEQLFSLIKFVETGTAVGGATVQVDNAYKNACRVYVRFADRLDGIFLSSTPQDVANAWNKGLETLRSNEVFAAYRPLVISDPHHPYILDYLYQSFHAVCTEVTGVPPLMNVMQDCSLMVLLPQDGFDEIVAQSIERTIGRLNFDTSLHITSHASISFINAAPDWASAQRCIQKASKDRTIRRAFSVSVADLVGNGKSEDKTEHEQNWSDLAAAAQVPINLKYTDVARLWPIITPVENETPEFEAALDVALLVVSIDCNQQTKDKKYTKALRESALIDCIGTDVPEWIQKLSPISRRMALSLWASSIARRDEELHERLFGAQGLLSSWYLANGMFRDSDDNTAVYTSAVRARLKAICSTSLVTAPEGNTASCIITGEPVNSDRLVSGGSKLYGIKTSAVSYREGRPENKFAETSGTHISDASFVEYRLRNNANPAAGSGSQPVRLSSTISGGLFGLAAAMGQTTIQETSLHAYKRDLLKENFSVTAVEGYEKPIRVGNYTSMPTKFVGRIEMFRDAIVAAQRSGKPIHIFQGIPQCRKEYFYCDFLDFELREILGRDGLRLEELPAAVRVLNLVSYIGRSKSDGGLGDVTTAKDFCLAKSRFSAACLAWLAARESESRPAEYHDLEDFINEEISKMKAHNASFKVTELARLARAVQKRPHGKASNTEERFMIRTAFDAAAALYCNNLRDRDDLIAGISGIILENADRRSNFFSAKENRRPDQTINAAVEEFSTYFVDRLWFGSFNGRPPSHSVQRVIIASYVFSFLMRGTALPSDIAEAA